MQSFSKFGTLVIQIGTFRNNLTIFTAVVFHSVELFIAAIVLILIPSIVFVGLVTAAFLYLMSLLTERIQTN